MSNDTKLVAAQVWCEEARRLLKVKQFDKGDRKALAQRADKVLAELRALDAGAQSGRFGLTAEEVTDYVDRFAVMAEALNAAARLGDDAAVKLQAERLQGLKRELAARLAGGEPSAKEPAVPDDEAGRAWLAALREAQQAIADLRLHAQAAAIDAELDHIVATQIEVARGRAHGGDAAGATALLAGVAPACERARELAESHGAYVDLLAALKTRLQACRSLPQAAAAAPELQQAEGKQTAAATRAEPGLRDPAGALALLREAWALSDAAEKVAQRCQAFAEARPLAVTAVNTLNQHAQAAAIAPELQALRQKLAQADTLAEPAARRYEDGVALLREVEADAAAATQLVERCGLFAARLAKVEEALEQARRHVQAEAIEAELGQAQARLEAAETLAASPARDHAGAGERLREAEALIEAGLTLAAQCQQAREARVPAMAALAALAEHPRLGAVRPRYEELLALQVQADRLAGRGERQYTQAQTLLAQIQTQAPLVRKQADQAMWAEQEAETVDDLLAGLHADSPERTRLGALWALAGERAKDGRHEEALRLLEQVRTLAAEARAAAQPVSHGRVEQGQAALEATLAESRLRSAALDAAQSLMAKELKAAVALGAAYAGTAPAAWLAETERIARNLGAARESERPALEAAVAQARLDIAAQEAAVRKLSEARSAWLACNEAYQAQARSLTAHAGGKNLFILTRLQAVKRIATASLAKAAEGSFDDARLALAAQAGEVSELLTLADAAARCQAVQSKRENELLAEPVAQTHPLCTAERLAAQTCLDEGKRLSTAGEFVDAIVQFDKIPAHLEKLVQLKHCAAAYKDFAAIWDPWVPLVESEPVKYKFHISEELAAVKAGVAAAKTAFDNGDLVGADMISKEITTLGNELYLTLLPGVKAYVDKALVFEAKVKEVEDHAGRPGIPAFWAQLKGEADFVLVCQAKRAYVAATEVMSKAQALIPPQLLIANRYVLHVAKRKAAQEKIDAARSLPGSDAAAAELAQAEQFMQLATEHQQTAALQAAVAKFDAADEALRQAEASVTAARTLLEKSQALTALKPADAGDLPARIAAVAGMKAQVKAQAAGDTSFDTLLDSTDALLAQARSALQGETPDAGAARIALDRVDAILADTLPKILRKPHCDSQLTALNQEVKAALPALNQPPHKCLDTEISQLDALLTQAKDRAKTPAFDFPGALTLAEQGLATAAKARAKHAAHVSLATDRQVITNMEGWLDDPNYQPAMARELARVKKINTDIDAALTAFDVPLARKLTAEGKALSAPYWSLCEAYTDIQTARTEIKLRAASKLLGKPAAKAEEDRYKEIEAQLDKMIDQDHAFTAAKQTIAHMKYLIDYAEAALARHAAFTSARTIQTARLTPLKPQTNPGVAEGLRLAEEALARADALALGREFTQATNELQTLAKLLDGVAADIPRYTAFASARDTARARLATLASHANAEVVKPLIDGIRARFEQAEAAGAARAYEDGLSIANEIPGRCDAATLTAEAHAEFDALGQGAAPTEKPVLQLACDKVKARLVLLRAEPVSEQQPGQVGKAFRQHAEAERLLAAEPLDAAKAVAALRAASTACVAAEIHRQQVIQVKQQLAAAQASVQASIDDPDASHAFVRPRMQATLAALGEVMAKLVAQGSDAAAKAVLAALAQFAADTALAKRKKAYDTTRLPLETSLVSLEKDRQRQGATTEIDLLRSKLVEAATAAGPAAPDFDRAMAALAAADAAASAARLAVALLADGTTPPSPTDIAKVLEQQPDGDAKLDAIVGRLDPTARRKLVQAAFEVRFGCKLDFSVNKNKTAGGDAPEPDAMRFYKCIAKLPPKHALKNDNLLLIEDERYASGDADFRAGPSSAFYPTTKKLAMREGRGVKTAGRMLGAEAALGPGVPDECKPANDEPVQYFDWNTLHEAGHTVEDKYMFMDKHAGDALYGGWTEYGGDLRRVAEKLVAEFDYDLSYTQELLGGVSDPPLPAPQTGVSPEAWEQRRVLLKTWVANAQKDKQPWETNSAAQMLRLKTGEIIHDAYGGHWYGYLASARSQGITGYQFRSPVEWFSELYAAYYTKKLKPGHPASTWLKALETA